MKPWWFIYDPRSHNVLGESQDRSEAERLLAALDDPALELLPGVLARGARLACKLEPDPVMHITISVPKK
jgi:hypothetical protein